MTEIMRSILIEENIDKVFEITNDLDRWIELFGGEYTNVEILDRQDNRIKFKLTSEDGRSWASMRYIDKENHVIKAERLEPKFPFKFMNIHWNYETNDAGTIMTWRQEYAVDDSLIDKTETIHHHIVTHTEKNQQRIKRIIEKEKVA